MTADPTISPDGNWRWDGTSWQPNTPPAPTPDAATPPPDAAAPPPVPADAGTTAAPAAATAAAPPAATPAANVGDVVNVNVNGDAFTGYVVGVVEGASEDYTDDEGNRQTRVLRDTGVLVCRLPDPVFVSNAALRD